MTTGTFNRQEVVGGLGLDPRIATWQDYSEQMESIGASMRSDVPSRCEDGHSHELNGDLVRSCRAGLGGAILCERCKVLVFVPGSGRAKHE